MNEKVLEQERMDMEDFIRKDLPQNFREINSKMQSVKLSKFEFPSFEIETQPLKESIMRIGTFKITSIANVNHGIQRFYNYQDPSDPSLIFQFRWNTRKVFYLE